jgi:hypothetical protein
MRVARWIGRLGVVPLPAVEVGLGLDARVVRRHVARLEQVSWLHRTVGIWGKGSVTWLTQSGLSAVGLGGLRAVRANPSPRQTSHGGLVSWSAAEAERRGQEWRSGRELALERERRAIRVSDHRGERLLLPDLAVWRPTGAAPVGVVAELGYRRDDRQLRILEAWREAINAGRYSAVRYDCGDELTARRMTLLGAKAGLDPTVFVAAVQLSPAEIAAIEAPRSHRQVERGEDSKLPDEDGRPRPKPVALPHRVAQLKADSGPGTGTSPALPHPAPQLKADTGPGTGTSPARPHSGLQQETKTGPGTDTSAAPPHSAPPLDADAADAALDTGQPPPAPSESGVRAKRLRRLLGDLGRR